MGIEKLFPLSLALSFPISVNHGDNENSETIPLFLSDPGTRFPFVSLVYFSSLPFVLWGRGVS